MATTTGTATDYLDLLTKLRDYLVDNDWVQVGGTASGAIVADSEFVSMQGPGLTGDDEILLSLQPFSVPANNAYSLRLRGHTAYVTPGTSQPGADSQWVYMLALNSPLTYWFVVNGRRFIVIVKSGSRYDAMYGGFILPDHLPNDWSYPLYIGASSYTGQVSQASDAPYHSNFWNPISSGSGDSNISPGGAYLFSPIQSWVPIRNGWANGATFAWSDTGRMTLPWWRGENHNVRRLLDGTPWVKKGQLAGAGRSSNGAVDTNLPEGGSFYGSFDGVFYTPAFGATAEQTVTIDTTTYMMVPNVGRTSDGHFAAIAME